MTAFIGRREFITCSAARRRVAVAARAQQPQRMRRIGVLDTLAGDDPEDRCATVRLCRGCRSLAGALAGMCASIRLGSWRPRPHSQPCCRSSRPVRCNLHERVLDHSAIAYATTRSRSCSRTRRSGWRRLRRSLARPGGNVTDSPAMISASRSGGSAAQADRAGVRASRTARSHDLRPHRPIRGHSGRGAIVRCGSDADRRAGWRRIAACRRRLPAWADDGLIVLGGPGSNAQRDLIAAMMLATAFLRFTAPATSPRPAA